MKANWLVWTLLFLLAANLVGCSERKESNQAATTRDGQTDAASPLPPRSSNATNSLAELKAKAEKGDVDAQFEFGVILAETDLTEAVKWFRKAAEQGDVIAQVLLGGYYGRHGVTQDYSEAVKWYRKAADQGFADAQYSLGARYAQGQGVSQDYAEAVKWFRKAAEQGDADAQLKLGFYYDQGQGMPKDFNEAVKWYRKAAEQGNADAQFNLGLCYYQGQGVTKDYTEAVKWWQKAAEQGDAGSQLKLGFCYDLGQGVQKDYTDAVKWWRKAAEQGDADAQFNLGLCCARGQGVPKDKIETYKWFNLAVTQGHERARANRDDLAKFMTLEEIAEAQRRSAAFVARRETAPSGTDPFSGSRWMFEPPKATGTGFFISEDGFLISNAHVIEGAVQIRLITSARFISAKVVKVDSANDLALLKAEGKFSPLPVMSSRSVKLGATVATVGFPNIGLQGFAPKLAKGEIASLTGAADDARYFQISVPVQPGNSGGALVDERGNAVGVVSAKLNARAALAASGALPENVNYAVKSSFLLSFLESVPEVAAKLKEPNTKEQKFEDVVKSAEQAAVLVLVY